MPYNPLIPGPNDLASVSQGQIKDNFTELQNVIQVNHGNFGSGDQGKHKFLQLPEQGSAPTTAVNEAGLYALVGPVSTVTELAFRRENNGTSIVFTEAVTTANGWTRLPSGMIMQWGLATVSTNGTAGTQVTFPIAFPTACRNVQLTQQVTAGGIYDFFSVVGTPSTTSFYAKPLTAGGSSTTNKSVYWFAIGI